MSRRCTTGQAPAGGQAERDLALDTAAEVMLANQGICTPEGIVWAARRILERYGPPEEGTE